MTAVLGSFMSALMGRAVDAKRWADAVERCKDGDPARPEAPAAEVWGVMVVRATLCRRGAEDMRATPMRPCACSRPKLPDADPRASARDRMHPEVDDLLRRRPGLGTLSRRPRYSGPCWPANAVPASPERRR